MQAIDELVIDPELQALLPELEPEEQEALRSQLQRDGCLDPILVNPQGIILDGHHRYDYCRELGIPYSTKVLPLTDRAEIKAWMLEHQLGRRNLTAKRRAYYVGELYKLRRGEQGGNRREPASGDAAQQVADLTGDSRRGVQQKARYSDALDRLAPAARQTLLGGIRHSYQAAEALARRPPEDQERLARAVRVGQFASLDDALGLPRRNGQPEPADPPPAAPEPEPAADDDGQPASRPAGPPTPAESPPKQDFPARLKAWNDEVEQFARAITGIAQQAPEGHWIQERLAIIRQQLTSTAATVRLCKCTAPCPRCREPGRECELCGGTAMLPRQRADMLRETEAEEDD